MDQLMPRANQDNTDRREFFRSIARYAVLGIMALGGLLAGRPFDKRRCVGRSICQACWRMDACELPPAMATKQRRQSARESSNVTGYSGKEA